MIIGEAIRKASSEHTICFLLTAYIEMLQFSGKLPERLTILPISGPHELRSRLENFVAELETIIRLPDSPTFFLLVEAVQVFEAALNRFKQLVSERVEQDEFSVRSPDRRPLLDAQAA